MIGDEGYGFFPSSRRVGLLCGFGDGTRELKGPGVQVRSKIGQNRTIQRSAKTASEYKGQSTERIRCRMAASLRGSVQDHGQAGLRKMAEERYHEVAVRVVVSHRRRARKR
jgi:hypothetical protein